VYELPVDSVHAYLVSSLSCIPSSTTATCKQTQADTPITQFRMYYNMALVVLSLHKLLLSSVLQTLVAAVCCL
jgi:hypothetical protein